MKCRFVCLLAALLLLSGCAKEGNYFVKGQYVCGASGRNYVICETDHDGVWYVLVENASDDSDLLTDVETGSFVSMQCSPRIEEGAFSHYTLIYSCDVKQTWKSKEIPAEHMEEIERVDALYQEAEE